MRKNCVAQEKSRKGNNKSGFKIIKETQMIFHGEEVLNIKLTCEKQTHDTALRMRVHNPDMLFKTSVLLRKAANTPIQTSVQIKQHIIQAGITRGYSVLSVGDGEDLLPLADGKAQRSRRINLHLLSSWLLARDAALR